MAVRYKITEGTFFGVTDANLNMSPAHNPGARIQLRTFRKYATNRIERRGFFLRRLLPHLVECINHGAIQISFDEIFISGKPLLVLGERFLHAVLLDQPIDLISFLD